MSYLAEQNGWMHGWEHAPRAVGESMAHPLLGYGGAWLGWHLAERRHEKPVKILSAAAAGVAIVNFGTELAQAAMDIHSRYANFLSSQNLPETTKDFVFALLGGGLFYLLNRSKKPATHIEPAVLFDWWEEVPELRPQRDWQIQVSQFDESFDA